MTPALTYQTLRMSSVDIQVVEVDPASSPGSKRGNAIKGGFLSVLIDMFDIYLPVVILAPIQSYFLAASAAGENRDVLDSLVFATTLVGRPVGALIFGRVADRIGRRKASIISVTGFGIFTLLIALLPGYATIGAASYALLVLLRFIDGIFLGGGYTGAIPLALEGSSRRQRGLVGGFIMAGYPAAYVLINLVAAAVLAGFPGGGTASPYARFGWRIPFVCGALLAGYLAVYYARKVPESAVWRHAAPAGGERAARAPLLRGETARSLLQVLLMMTGFWLTQNIVGGYLPSGVLVKALHLTAVQMTDTLLITYVVLFGAFIAAGIIGQRIGRRRFMTLAALLQASLGAWLLHRLIGSAGAPLALVVANTCVLAMLVSPCWAAIITFMNERFATGVRATGFGIGYSLSVIAPSFFAFYMKWLGHVVPAADSPVALLVIGGAIAAIGAWLGPETNHVEL